MTPKWYQTSFIKARENIVYYLLLKGLFHIIPTRCFYVKYFQKMLGDDHAIAKKLQLTYL